MGVKISNLPAIVTPALTDVFPVVQGGVTYKETMTQLKSLFNLPATTGPINSLLRSDGTNYVATTATRLSAADALSGLQSVTSSDVIQSTGASIISGSSSGGFQGKFVVFPITTAKGSFALTGVDNSANYSNQLTHAATTATRIWTLPDATGTIALTSSGGLTYNSVAGTTQTSVAGNAYILNNAGATTVTLPTTASSTIGDMIKIKGRSAAAWIIQAAAGQIITDGAVSSTVAGTATSAAGTDSIQLVYVAANEWSVDWQLSAGIVLA